MSNKFSNKKLSILFVILLVIAAIFYLPDSSKNERTFRDKLVDIDTSSVSEIVIFPKSLNGGYVKLFKDENIWKVNLANEKTANVQEGKLNNILSQLLSIKPKRLAARGEDKWTEFEVDSTGTRVIVNEDGDTTLDIIIGRFSFQQPRSMSTFVRLYNDTDVYEVDGFLAATFNQDADNYRDGSVIKDDYNNWNSLTFNYPADSSFQLVKMNDQWFANNEPTDSVKTVDYLRKLSRLSSTNFVDDIDPSLFDYPDYVLTIDMEDGNIIEVKGMNSDSLFVINSSYNPEFYFNGTKNNFKDKVFIGLSSLKK